MTTLLLQLTTNNNNNKENGEVTFSPPPPTTNPLLDVFQATVVESSGDGGNGVFYERRVDDVIVVDADKRLFYCVRDAIDQNGNMSFTFTKFHFFFAFFPLCNDRLVSGSCGGHFTGH